ncbi:ABC transporter substrate-binding protein [Amycolatopsis sp.]|uniref:ABC transporter substrate-binding protein n=1 Tax=Amycolatopsis sp. TaxID=37632 RepID=UPI002DF79D0C|nr:ABC transporter substrate-binding protein [Amycolatopsis sp.]
MTRNLRRATALVLGLMTMTACGSVGAGPKVSATVPITASKFFNPDDFERQLVQRDVTPEGASDAPWAQSIAPSYVDTKKYAKAPKWHLCFSNAGLDNPWRVTGLTTMKAEVLLHREISKFTIVDAESRDEKQIADLEGLHGKGCNALIVSPNTADALTPAVQKACESGIPIVVFDRGVNTTCPVTFVHSIGGYAFGATGAEFVAKHMKPGGNVLALRTLPGVDTLENRWAAADMIFSRSDAKVVGTEFTDGDPVKVKAIIADYLRRYGDIHGLWLDTGPAAVAAVEAFQAAGKPVPPMTSEDQQDFLELWKKQNLTAISPTYPVYMWRTAVIAATDILAGKEVPRDWVLPQPVITSVNLEKYLTPGMPPVFYPTCGCQKMPGFPQAWSN